MNKYLSLALMVIFTTSGMLLLKKGATNVKKNLSIFPFIRQFINPLIILGSLLLCIAPIFYLYAITEIKLSTAYTFSGLNYIFIFIGGWMILKEKLNIIHMIGIICIAGGVIIFHS